MITFDEGDNRFNYRIAGVAVHNDSILLHQAEGDAFWTFPGGRAEFGESAQQTMRREMREEMGADVEVIRLLWLVENFFTYANRDYHELSLYFLIRLQGKPQHVAYPGPFHGHEETGVRLIFQWFPNRPELLESLPLLPSFLQRALQVLPESVVHIVQDERPIRSATQSDSKQV